MREPSHSPFKGAGLDRPVLTGLTQTTTSERECHHPQVEAVLSAFRKIRIDCIRAQT
jgi:hypothetical protein